MTVNVDEGLRARVTRVKQAIEAATARSGRQPREVTLVGVSKTVGPEQVREAVELGIRHFGENRVQEAEAKVEALAGQLATPVDWHLIGHLQSNKARKAARLFAVIESVDTLDLAIALSRIAEATSARLAVLLEVNVSGEASKFGFAPEALAEVFPRLIELPGLEVRGLMTVAPAVKEMEDARPVFRGLRELRERLSEAHPRADLRELSMGMTGDFPVAIEEGATLIRVGRALFGERLA
ncbi:MAG: YggS family pyridoxal phosphate-dependent enzyme [Chloroflexota bacterium]